ncbi:MAG: TonB-dependent receptor [Paludibacteraceae bacterium]|nr:TonB-dependent receptor [Paludibacteraceae bacterium]
MILIDILAAGSLLLAANDNTPTTQPSAPQVEVEDTIRATGDEETSTLETITVSAQHDNELQRVSSTPAVTVGHEFLNENFSGSLVQTLEQIPGVKAMSIGSSQSKPIIRGLGFNRLVITENGIKHEGQQWGDDHGLEIDQFSVERAEVIKGPAALLYGSDAIGGVLSLYTNQVPTKKMEGAVQLFGHTNNNLWGASAKLGGKHKRFYYRVNATYTDYADYKVPTDSIQYYSYWIKLNDQRLRNTAGKECDGSVLLGYSSYNFRTSLHVSDTYAKNGFFANAHGLEVRLSDIDYDHSKRDIDLPYQWVNHLKVANQSLWEYDDFSVQADLAFQNNLREEHSEPISHGYMPQPDGTMERRFDKNTYTANIMLKREIGKNTLQTGISGEYQYNRIGGWGFIIPDFETMNLGGYVMDRYSVNDNLTVNAGIRFDYAKTHIHSYSDWYETPVNGDTTFVKRSNELWREFHSLNWSVGINQTCGKWNFKANIGKSFRVPIPKELGVNGINYHVFRYERGNAELDPETSYQLDAGISRNTDVLEIQVDPYLNYFPNYIYLNPTPQYVEGLQLYHYIQAAVLRYGLEAQLKYHISRHWQANVQGEYLYAEQLSGDKKGYTLPFSPPWTASVGLKYEFKLLGKAYIGADTRIVGRQDEIVPPEKVTDGHCTLALSAGDKIKLKNTTLNVVFHVNNLLNQRYYDHTSYYRLIDVPEPGRDFSMMLGVEF